MEKREEPTARRGSPRQPRSGAGRAKRCERAARARGGGEEVMREEETMNRQVKNLGLYRILIWPDIRPIILPDTGYPAKN